MHKKMISLFAFIVLSAGFFISQNTCMSKPDEKVREAAVAGGFYPGNPDDLATLVDQMLAQAEKNTPESPVFGLIVPHAGYVYSGHVAASGYALLKGRKIDRVVVISPCHIDAFHGVSVFAGDAYVTPLGRVVVDKNFAQELANSSDRIQLSDKGHVSSEGGRGEHALEVQLPFLQRVLGDFKLVPLVMGEQSYETCRALGSTLAKLIDDPKTIIVASSDLSHFHPYQEAVQLDHKVINAVLEWDYYNLSRNLNARIWEACGGGPIVTTMIAMERLGAKNVQLIKYANSGDVANKDKSRVVGVFSHCFYEKSRGKHEA